MRWVSGMEGVPDPADRALFARALICRRFPQYRLEELDGVHAPTLYRAVALLDLAEKALS